MLWIKLLYQVILFLFLFPMWISIYYQMDDSFSFKVSSLCIKISRDRVSIMNHFYCINIFYFFNKPTQCQSISVHLNPLAIDSNVSLSFQTPSAYVLHCLYWCCVHLSQTSEVIRMKNIEVFQKDVIKGFGEGFVIQSVG